MTDYNDGKWHGWNGGECPVHPKTCVKAVEDNGARWESEAENCSWISMKGAFLVVKEYRQPREFWLFGGFDRQLKVSSTEPETEWHNVIHVREVQQ